AHASFQHRRDFELRADLGEVDRRAAERERRRTRGHVQAGQLGEGVDDLFGDALTEILELGIAAQVYEWQNRDRLASLARGGGFLARRQGRGVLGGRREPIRQIGSETGRTYETS